MVWRAATNAYKWSNASGNAATPQTDIDVYNNTAVECGWRQTKTGRGGSINVEKGGRGQCYNNLIVNCRFGVKQVADADNANLKIGYTHYYGTDAVMSAQFYPTDGVLKKGDKETGKDIVGDPLANDPKFVKYTVSSYTSTYPVDPATLDYRPADANFRLAAGAPGLTAGNTTITLKGAITVNGVTYTPPALSAFIGAYGSN